MRTSRRVLVHAVSLCALVFLATGSPAAETTESRAVRALIRQPLRFESLDGGLLARGGGYSMWLMPGSAAVSLNGGSKVVRMTWPGADTRVQPAGAERSAGTTNYLLGSDPSRWRHDVPSFAKARYRSLYPGIDLVFYGNRERLEYDFVVSPGGDPRNIRLRFSGEDAVRIDAQGNLVIRAGDTEMVQRAPVVYQDHGGTRQAVAGRYVQRSRHEVGFSIAAYDRASTLYIDPVLTFSSFFGGNAVNIAQAVAVDASGNAYVTGYTNSTNFPTTGGAYQTACASCPSNNDVFVTKISSTGVLIYSTFVGDVTDDKAHAIAVDSAGNAYVTGETYYTGSGPSFPVVNGFTAIDARGGGAFLFKLDSTGSSLLYSTQIRSGSASVGYGVAVEGSNAYVVGVAVANDAFPRWPTSGTYSGLIGSGGNYEAFILKVNTSASDLASLVYATRFGGWDAEYAYAVAVNSAGEAYVTGYTTSYDFPTVNPAQAACGTAPNCDTSHRAHDAFIAKFNAAGNGLVYSTFAGGTKDDNGYGIAIDASGNAYVAGTTASSDFPKTNGAFDTTCGNNALCDTTNDAFALKLSPNGSSFLYSTFLGGGSNDVAQAIAVDVDGYAYVAGYTTSADFPVSAGAIQPSRNGTNTDAFVSMIDPTGSSVVYSTYLGGSASISGGDEAFGIALDPAGDVWLVGQTDSANFPVKTGAISIVHSSGNFDGFVVKIGDPLSLTAVVPSSGGTSGGPVKLTGTGFMAGAAVTFGGSPATSVSVLSPTTITATRPAHAAGAVDVTVTSLDGQVSTLAGGFTYVSVTPLTFTDDPLQAGITPVRAVHLTELRTAINTLRSRYGLSAATWPSGAINIGTVVQAAHLNELRSALTDVYNAGALTPPTWSPATITGGTTTITAAQITQVRTATLALW